MPATVKVLIVDDTIIYRTILRNIVESLPNSEVVDVAPHGKLALTKLKSSPQINLVLLDIEMPEMDGLETLKWIKAEHPNVGVVMISGCNRSSADITVKALEQGAIDFIPKPEASSMTENIELLREPLKHVIRHFCTLAHLDSGQSEAARFGQNLLKTTASVPKPITVTKLHPIQAIGIGVSTGGPNALNVVLPELPANLGVPIFIVQHMPPVFTASLASSLDKKSSITVKEAEEGEIALPNVAYIAPGGKHMTVHKSQKGEIKIQLNTDPPENSCRPAVDVLFRSLADTYGAHGLPVIMTGMGSDGAKGVAVWKQHGVYCLTQSEQTCVVYGMPGAVAQMNLSDESVALENLATRITTLVKVKKQ